MVPQEKHASLFEAMVLNKSIKTLTGSVLISNVAAEVNKLVDQIFKNRVRYQAISSYFPNPIRWYHVGIIHYLECDLDFSKYLGNGQPLNKKTTIVPVGRGPFETFEEGAVDAIRVDKLDQVTDWSIGNTLYILEGFNGYGYSKFHDCNSPYLYSGSNQYTAGKYVKDGLYNKNTVSAQIGAALLLKEILKRLSDQPGH